MSHDRAEPISTETPDIAAEQRARLRELFPEAFTEGRVDFEKLRATLGDLVEVGPERCRFTHLGGEAGRDPAAADADAGHPGAGDCSKQPARRHGVAGFFVTFPATNA
jgi:hypothetical protein